MREETSKAQAVDVEKTVSMHLILRHLLKVEIREEVTRYVLTVAVNFLT